MQTTRSWLTVDQGNTSLDVVWFRSCETSLEVVESWRSLSIASLPEIEVATHAADCQVVVSSVSGRPARQALMDKLGALWPDVSVPDAGLELQVDTPETTGADRLFAARAASELARGRTAIVVDVGTAMTVDLVQDSAFLGGAIAPGPGLLAKALGSGGAQLFEVEPRPGSRALGKSTAEALEAGVVVGLRGAARELVEQLRAEATEPGEVFVTGGARELLLSPAPFFPGIELLEVPLLVHLGLLFAGGFRGDGVGSPDSKSALDGLIRRHGSSSA